MKVLSRVYDYMRNHNAQSSELLRRIFGLTDAPLASAVELRALQVIVVTRVMRVVLVVGVMLVVLSLLDNIISRTSSKHK